MSRLIQQLIDECSEETWVPGTGTLVHFDKETFARLIIHHCLRRVSMQHKFDEENDGQIYIDIIRDIKTYFEV